MNIKSMLIRNGYPKAYIDRCIMKYLNKKHETSVNSFTITPPMTTTINMRLPYLGEISYEIRREMQRLVHRYAIIPFQFRFIDETNKLKKSFTYKDKQNHLRSSSVVYKLTCTCGSNYIGQTRRNLITRINEHKFDQRSQVCKHLLANPTHCFNFKQLEASSVRRNFTYSSLFWYGNTSQISTSMVHPFHCCFLTHNGLYDATQYKCPKLHPYCFL